MTLVDREIATLVKENGLIEQYSEDSLTNIGYDLHAKVFTQGETSESKVILKPGESAFVSSEENIKLPNNILARVTLKNSRMRQGFSLDAPVYQPGHHTKVFFRLTNVSADELIVKAGEKYATIQFEKLDSTPDIPYQGSFKEELDFKGMGAYKDLYQNQIQKIEEKTEDIKSLEKSIYGNVLVILTVFVALFSFLTTNISLLSADAAIGEFLVYNFITLGCISSLVALLTGIINKEQKKLCIWTPAITFFAIALAIFICI